MVVRIGEYTCLFALKEMEEKKKKKYFIFF